MPTVEQLHLSNVEDALYALIDLLKSEKAPSKPGAGVEHIALLMSRHNWMREGTASFEETEDIRDERRLIIGLYHLSNLLLHHKNHPSFPGLRGHLRLLAAAEPESLSTMILGRRNDPAASK